MIVALGKIAFDTCVDFYILKHGLTDKFKFGHAKFYNLPNDVILVGCYHPSPRNVNTGRLNFEMMVEFLSRHKKEIE